MRSLSTDSDPTIHSAFIESLSSFSRLHRAQQAMLELAPPGSALKRAQYDWIRLKGSNVPDSAAYQALLLQSIDVLSRSARESVESNLRRLEKQHPHLRRAGRDDLLESSLVALDVRTGAILAMVGGRDYSISQFNRAAQAERPPVAQATGQPEPATGLAPPVEEPLEREQDQGQHDEERPELTLDQHRRRLGPRLRNAAGRLRRQRDHRSGDA